jgi:hypothetical protein
VQGSIAAGMGQMAAGAGAYNVQTAQAAAMNTQTAMQWNSYVYACNKQNAAMNLARRERQQKNLNESADAVYKRVRDNPDPHDIHTGDALNIVLNELCNPAIYTQVVQKSTTPIASQLVKSINFQHVANMVLISLDDISARGVPDALATNPAFEPDRQAIRALVKKGRTEGQSGGQIAPETIRSFRAAVQAAKDKADSLYAQGTRQRSESDNFLKALLGVSKMLERPEIETFLEGLNRYPSTTLGHLISFMHSFNLRFGPAKTPDQEATYDRIYPMLAQLLNQAQGPGAGTTAAHADLPDPKQAMAVFSGVPLGTAQPPAPPAPGAPR